ncbi:16S rRNA (uracil(1498)-N(3))-methyltransferase [Lichenicola sp.]|uniref:16S rRNA (uracil(1498)-N(3))-methyltransferase n=1 Tax=Lichenicola sp. TaxID=2804529 RepID=UPI003B005E24
MQDLPRLYAEPGDEPAFDVGAVVPMAPGQAHYLGNVLRRAAGDTVHLFNAVDGEWLARIEGLRKDRGQFAVERQVRPGAPEPGPILVFAPLKRDATDLVVRMATELGVAALAPVLTERTNTPRINVERWRAIAIEAAEQCERLSVPAIHEPVRLFDLLSAWDPARPMLAAIERPGAWKTEMPAGGIAAWRARTDPAVQPGLLVGPEGGFAPSELALLRRYPCVVGVSLGRLILRAETACMAGLAALLG